MRFKHLLSPEDTITPYTEQRERHKIKPINFPIENTDEKCEPVALKVKSPIGHKQILLNKIV